MKSFAEVSADYLEGERLAKVSVWTLVGLGVIEVAAGQFMSSVGLAAQGEAHRCPERRRIKHRVFGHPKSCHGMPGRMPTFAKIESELPPVVMLQKVPLLMQSGWSGGACKFTKR